MDSPLLDLYRIGYQMLELNRHMMWVNGALTVVLVLAFFLLIWLAARGR